MRTILFILTLIGLQFTTGCKVTNNYYSIYPTKVERIETKQPEWPYGGGIDWGIGIAPSPTREWITISDLIPNIDTSKIAIEYDPIWMDGDSITCTCGATFYIGNPFQLDIDYCPKCNKAY